MLSREWKIVFDWNHRFHSDLAFSSAGRVGQKLAGHLWASKNCCDCVISLLMKKPGGTFDLLKAPTVYVLLSLCEWLNEKPKHQILSFLYSVYSLSMFTYLWWCFNKPYHAKCTMSKAMYSYCLTSSIIPVNHSILTQVERFPHVGGRQWNKSRN